jgi:hypothetical protein
MISILFTAYTLLVLDFLALKMEAECFYEILVNLCLTTLRITS